METNRKQTAHMQIEKIKTKLASMARFAKFLGDRFIFAGLNRMDLKDLQFFLNELKKDLKLLIREREHYLNEFKPEILLTLAGFARYGSSEHVKELTDLLKLIMKVKLIRYMQVMLSMFEVT